jgi:hypothetical protein
MKVLVVATPTVWDFDGRKGVSLNYTSINSFSAGSFSLPSDSEHLTVFNSAVYPAVFEFEIDNIERKGKKIANLIHVELVRSSVDLTRVRSLLLGSTSGAGAGAGAVK